MITTKKIVGVAHSLGIIIDKSIIELLNLKKGDYVEIDIKKIKKSEDDERGSPN